ncbi:MAG TPA: NADH-quinone oxidoreductase subunit J [Anaerolineales bacterium]
MLRLLLIALLLIFAIQSLRARALLTGALWLAGVSALSSVLFFLYDARLVAVVELSVGAGLVTVLFVFAINIAGDEAIQTRSVPPRRWMAALAVLFILLLGWFVWPSPAVAPSASVAEAPLSVVLWQDRGLDLMVQVVLIFSGVLGLLGLLAEARAPLDGSMAREVAARRDRDLRRMESRALPAQEVGK